MKIKTLDSSERDLAIDSLARALRDDTVINWIGNKTQCIGLLASPAGYHFATQACPYPARELAPP